MKYPKRIFVQEQNGGTQDEYLQAEKESNKLEDGKIAIYELKQTVTKYTTTHLK